EKQLGHKFQLQIDPNLFRTTDEKIIVGDVSKLKAATGWKQTVPMEETIKDMLEYWRRRVREK
ncbi:MAG: GDP-mannose 4,6-dehydratase, partial [Peptoniphilus sp.]|nr:GDP-mannose 4,6-dehydratase [Peptoniphilus sp.]